MSAAPSAAEIFLCEFHDSRPGLTDKAFGTLVATMAGRSYPSSYQLLADAVSRAAVHVLDLACGAGHLLAMLQAGRGTGDGLVGVDLSKAELLVARARLPAAVTLFQARAQALPLPSASLDCVVSHMALMLMGEADPVLREVRRVLRPGGCFAGVVGAQPPDVVAWRLYLEAFARRPQHERWAGLRLGDRRWRDCDGIRRLLASDFGAVVVQDIAYSQRLTPAELWLHFLDMYDVYFLAEAERLAMERDYLVAVKPHCEADGRLELPGAMRFFSARAA